jgi:HSP20 family protein
MNAPTKDTIPALQRNAMNAFAPLQREFNRFIGELGEGFEAFTESRLAPRMDVVDTDKAIEVSVELPGLKAEDVKITCEDEMLVISGEKKSEHEKKDKGYRVLERSYGEFTRAVYLPRSADASKITASMTDGVLKVIVPKTAAAATKTIEIQSA